MGAGFGFLDFMGYSDGWGQKIVEAVGHFRDDWRPIDGAGGLTEEDRRSVPRHGVEVKPVTPCRARWGQYPYWYAHAASKVDNAGTDGDNEVQIRNKSSNVVVYG